MTLMDNVVTSIEYIDYGKNLDAGPVGFRVRARTAGINNPVAPKTKVETPTSVGRSAQDEVAQNPLFKDGRFSCAVLLFGTDPMFYALHNMTDPRLFQQLHIAKFPNLKDLVGYFCAGLSPYSQYLFRMRDDKADAPFPHPYALPRSSKRGASSKPLLVKFRNAAVPLDESDQSPLKSSNTLLFPWRNDDLHRTLARMWWHINLHKQIYMRYDQSRNDLPLEIRMWLCEALQHLVAPPPLGRFLSFALDNFLSESVDILFVDSDDKNFTPSAGMEGLRPVSDKSPLTVEEALAFEFLSLVFGHGTELSWETTYVRWQREFVGQHLQKSAKTSKHYFSSARLGSLMMIAQKGRLSLEQVRTLLKTGKESLCVDIIENPYDWLATTAHGREGNLSAVLMEEAYTDRNTNPAYLKAVWAVKKKTPRDQFLELYAFFPSPSVIPKTIKEPIAAFQDLIPLAHQFTGLGLQFFTQSESAEQYADHLIRLLTEREVEKLRFVGDRSPITEVVDHWDFASPFFGRIAEAMSDTQNSTLRRRIFRVALAKKNAKFVFHFMPQITAEHVKPDDLNGFRKIVLSDDVSQFDQAACERFVEMCRPLYASKLDLEPLPISVFEAFYTAAHRGSTTATEALRWEIPILLRKDKENAADILQMAIASPHFFPVLRPEHVESILVAARKNSVEESTCLAFVCDQAARSNTVEALTQLLARMLLPTVLSLGERNALLDEALRHTALKGKTLSTDLKDTAVREALIRHADPNMLNDEDYTHRVRLVKDTSDVDDGLFRAANTEKKANALLACLKRIGGKDIAQGYVLDHPNEVTPITRILKSWLYSELPEQSPVHTELQDNASHSSNSTLPKIRNPHFRQEPNEVKEADDQSKSDPEASDDSDEVQIADGITSPSDTAPHVPADTKRKPRIVQQLWKRADIAVLIVVLFVVLLVLLKVGALDDVALWLCGRLIDCSKYILRK